MNKLRRSTIRRASALISKAISIVDSTVDEEKESLESFPENLRYSVKGEAMENAIDEMQDAIDSLNSASESLDRAIQ